MKTSSTVVAVCVSLLAVYVAPWSSAETQTAGSTTTVAVEAATSAFHNALRTNDFETFMSYVAEDVLLMPPGEAPVRGKDAVGAWYSAFLSQFRTSSLTLSDQEIFLGDKWAVELGTYEWGLTPSAGGVPIVDHGTYMQVWKLQGDGEWRFAREIYNSSVPPEAPQEK